jgi:septal ring factor EnvC (AmiA/AmiB activator)
MGGLGAHAQENRKELEKEKAQILVKIKEIEGILSKTTKEKQNNLQELNALNSQIKEQERLISTMDAEVKALEAEIRGSIRKIEKLESDLGILKEEYAAMVYATSKMNQSQNEVLFLFASQSFYQLYMRYSYLRQYADARKKQAEQIEKTKYLLQGELEATQTKREDQRRLLAEQLAENRALLSLKSEQQATLNVLSKRETQLRRDLNDRKSAVEKLNTLIAEAVKAEIARETAAASKVSEADARSLGAESLRLSTVFAENKARLPWPVPNGFISQRFGNQPHPTLKGITIPNDGVDIRTSPNAPVQAIFDGEVTSIASVPGMNTVVLIKHGEYFSVYARLGKVNVKSGQTVAAGAIIGETYTNSQGIAELQFQIWKSTQALNPQDWMVRK